MKMTSTQQRVFAAAIAVAVWGAASSAQAQTIVNLTNLDPTNITGYGTSVSATSGSAANNAATNLDLLNSTTALTNGGLFPGAVSNQSQAAYNQLNTIGINANGTVSPVVLGNQTPVAGSPNQVQINTITSAYNGAFGGTPASGSTPASPGLTINGASSTTINNINAAISSAVNPIVGANATLNSPWTGGYGGAASGAAVTANQVGVNTINGVGASFADGTNIALSQLPGAPTPSTVPSSGSVAAGTTPVIQGGSLNMSTTNTLLAYATAGTVSINGNNGVDSKGAPVRGNQSAVNTFNASTLMGTNLSVGAQQLADGLNAYQSGIASINRALAYSPGNQAANIDPSVTNLNQTASVGMNALNLQQSGTTATETTLSGIQTVGYNTIASGGTSSTAAGAGSVAGVGSTPIAVTTNQIVASTVTAGGFMPTSATAAGDWAGFANTTASGMPMPGATGYSASPAAQNGVAFLGTSSFNPNAVTSGAYSALNAGTVNVANASQAVNLTNNTVSAGSSANPVNVTFGPAGFEQRTGQVGIASNTAGGQTTGLTTGLGSSVTSPGGLSNAQALTGVGSSSISALAQSFQTANNTFQGSGDVSGSLTQSSTGVKFNAAEITAGSSTSSGIIASVNGGSGLTTGALGVSSNNAYVLDTAGTTGSALNNAVAGAVYGPSSLTDVGQAGTTYANIAAATGTLDTAASGTLAQELGAIVNYKGVQNSAVASTVASGNVAAINTNQSLNVTGNAVQAAAVNGSIAQLASGSNAIGAATGGYGATNAVLAAAGNGSGTGQGSAALNGTVQSNTTTLNAIQSAGALGSSTVPAAFSQQNGTSTTQLGLGSSAFAAAGYGVNSSMAAPSNLAVVQTTNGAGASATANNTQQVARLSVNSLTGGTAAGLGLTGAATQASYGQTTSIGNQALAYAGNAPRGDTTPTAATVPGATTGGVGPASNIAVGSTLLGAQGVMGGNAALTNQQQLAGQSLNTMSLAGANNGNVNQATFGATNQTTGNQLYAQSNGGYALTTGVQSATNAVNVITAR